MPQPRLRPANRASRESPELLISFLRYALDDVRALSERGGRHLELAISALAEDTSVIDVAEEVPALHQRS